MSVLPATIVHRSTNAIALEIDRELVVMNIVSGGTFGLDSRGKRIWAILEKPVTIDQIVATLVQCYDTTETQCRGDVIGFVEELLEHQLVATGEADP